MDTSRTVLPTFDEIRALHQKYAPTEALFDLIFTHCLAVRDIALQLIDTSGAPVDRDLVEVGCLLHDIGAYEFFSPDGGKFDKAAYIAHGVRGEEILRKEGYPEALCRFASHHTGVGLTKEHIIERDLPLPHLDYLAESPEEELVMYADKFHSKGSKLTFNSVRYYTQFAAQFGIENVNAFHNFMDTFGTPDLEPLVEKYGHHFRS